MKKGSSRRRIEAAVKAKVAIAALREQQTTAQIGSTFGVHSTLVTKWKKQAQEALPGIFAKGNETTEGKEVSEKLVSGLYEEIGRLKMEVDWLKKKLSLCQ